MSLLPGFHAVDGEEEVRVLGKLCRAVDDAHRRHKIFHRDGVGAAVFVVAAADPVHRSVEMSARMLAELEPVPGPVRPGFVVVRNCMNFDRRRVGADLRRQFDQWRFRTKRRGQVHHFDGTGRERRGKITENLCAGHAVSPWRSLRKLKWDVCDRLKPSANILDMKYQRWQATRCGADQECANVL